jgi:hypothetical protein
VSQKLRGASSECVLGAVTSAFVLLLLLQLPVAASIEAGDSTRAIYFAYFASVFEQ